MAGWQATNASGITDDVSSSVRSATPVRAANARASFGPISQHIRNKTLGVHAYEVGPRKDRRGVDLISDALPFGRLWYDGPNAASNAIGYASQYSRSHGAVISVYDEAGNLIETQEYKGDFKEW